MTEQSSSQHVEIDYAPEVPKTQPELLVSILKATETVHIQLATYLSSGNILYARKAANALLFMSAARTRGQFAHMLSQLTRGEHPLTDEQREEAWKDVSL